MGVYEKRFLEMGEELCNGLEQTNATDLVRSGFAIGTARFFQSWDSPERTLTTTRFSITRLVEALYELGVSAVSPKDLERFYSDVSQTIRSVPDDVLIDNFKTTKEYINRVTNDDGNNNFNNKKLVKLADKAHELKQEERVEVAK